MGSINVTIRAFAALRETKDHKAVEKAACDFSASRHYNKEFGEKFHYIKALFFGITSLWGRYGQSYSASREEERKTVINDVLKNLIPVLDDVGFFSKNSNPGPFLDKVIYTHKDEGWELRLESGKLMARVNENDVPVELFNFNNATNRESFITFYKSISEDETHQMFYDIHVLPTVAVDIVNSYISSDLSCEGLVLASCVLSSDSFEYKQRRRKYIERIKKRINDEKYFDIILRDICECMQNEISLNTSVANKIVEFISKGFPDRKTHKWQKARRALSAVVIEGGKSQPLSTQSREFTESLLLFAFEEALPPVTDWQNMIEIADKLYDALHLNIRNWMADNHLYDPKASEFEKAVKMTQALLKMERERSDLCAQMCYLNIGDTNMTKIPSVIRYFTELESLELQNCPLLKNFEGMPHQANKLKYIHCTSCTSLESLKGLPHQLPELHYISLANCTSLKNFEGLPDKLPKLCCLLLPDHVATVDFPLPKQFERRPNLSLTLTNQTVHIL